MQKRNSISWTDDKQEYIERKETLIDIRENKNTHLKRLKWICLHWLAFKQSQLALVLYCNWKFRN